MGRRGDRGTWKSVWKKGSGLQFTQQGLSGSRGCSGLEPTKRPALESLQMKSGDRKRVGDPGTLESEEKRQTCSQQWVRRRQRQVAGGSPQSVVSARRVAGPARP